MADMTASGWYPSNVNVIRSWRPWGPNSLRHALVQMTMEATNFGNGAHLYPAEGIPAPAASTVGFRESVEYIIPISPFTRVSAPGRVLVWGCLPPTYGASGGTVSTGPRMTFQSGRVTGGPVSSAGGVDFLEAVSGLAATDIFATQGSTFRGYGIFVGK